MRLFLMVLGQLTHWVSFQLHPNVDYNESYKSFNQSRNKIKMKGPLTLIKPLRQRSKSALTKNMFRDPDQFEEAPTTSRDNIEQYDFVGPADVRKKLLTSYAKPMKLQQRSSTPQNEETVFNQTTSTKNGFNTTINRTTMLDSLHKQQLIEYTKQTRIIQKYKEYQDDWQKQKGHIKNQTMKKNPILMDTNIKNLYVHPNERKIDTINHYIVHYWEMSLRNNNPILQRHIKGHRFDKIEKEKLLQLREGTKKVQSSIPALPIEKLGSLRKRQLSLNGKNKIQRQLEYQSEVTNQTRQSLPISMRSSQQEVFKINYDGNKKWLGLENM